MAPRQADCHPSPSSSAVHPWCSSVSRLDLSLTSSVAGMKTGTSSSSMSLLPPVFGSHLESLSMSRSAQLTSAKSTSLPWKVPFLSTSLVKLKVWPRKEGSLPSTPPANGPGQSPGHQPRQKSLQVIKLTWSTVEEHLAFSCGSFRPFGPCSATNWIRLLSCE